MGFEFPTRTLNEGRVKVLVPRLESFVEHAWEYAPAKAPVFYNPAMELNRDLAVLALQAYHDVVKRQLLACEPLAGCGVRGVRLAAEVSGVRRVIINDISLEASRLAEFNVKLNSLTDRVVVVNKDANYLLGCYAAPRKRFDYVDVDPFGTPAPYLDAAVRALRDKGLLALTATDMAPLCGVHSKACIRKYGGKPLRTEYCHELAVRLMIGCAVSIAARHDIGVHPLLSYSEYNYVRTYVTVDHSAKAADDCIENMGYILHCFSCFHREPRRGIVSYIEKECPECGSKLAAAGPLWMGPLWDADFCVRIRDSAKHRSFQNGSRILQMMSLIVGEVQAPVTYYVIDKVCDKFSLPVPSTSRVVAQLRKEGFKTALTHFNNKGLRTDASARDLTRIVSELVKISAEQVTRN